MKFFTERQHEQARQANARLASVLGDYQRKKYPNMYESKLNSSFLLQKFDSHNQQQLGTETSAPKLIDFSARGKGLFNFFRNTPATDTPPPGDLQSFTFERNDAFQGLVNIFSEARSPLENSFAADNAALFRNIEQHFQTFLKLECLAFDRRRPCLDYLECLLEIDRSNNCSVEPAFLDRRHNAYWLRNNLKINFRNLQDVNIRAKTADDAFLFDLRNVNVLSLMTSAGLVNHASVHFQVGNSSAVVVFLIVLFPLTPERIQRLFKNHRINQGNVKLKMERYRDFAELTQIVWNGVVDAALINYNCLVEGRTPLPYPPCLSAVERDETVQILIAMSQQGLSYLSNCVLEGDLCAEIAAGGDVLNGSPEEEVARVARSARKRFSFQMEQFLLPITLFDAGFCGFTPRQRALAHRHLYASWHRQVVDLEQFSA